MPPPAALHFINGFLHRYHWLSVIANWIVWSIVLVCIAPIGLPVFTLRCLYELLFVRYFSTAPNTQQGILITGCDTGFGYDLAVAASKAGYKVFAGCLDVTKCSTIPGVVAIPMDVTNDAQVDAAIQVIRKWMDEEEGRHLFALVNNAGVGSGSPIDWMEMKDFEFCMNVNYFGLIRCIKAALPIFRSQYAQEHRGRIINITSMAGLVLGPGMAAYSASKHAANVASHVLRIECQDFLDVVTVNPSFHATPLLSRMDNLYTEDHFNKLPADIRAAYGLEYVLGFRKQAIDLPMQWAWRPKVVLDMVMDHVLRQVHPPSQVLVGSDARFGMTGLRLIPPWLMETLQNLMPLPTPALCKKRKND